MAYDDDDDDDYDDAFDCFEYGSECYSDDKYDEAIEWFTKALTAKRNDEFALSNLYCLRGMCYYAKDEDNKAISDFTKALELDLYTSESDKNFVMSSIYYSRGLCYCSLEDWVKGKKDIQKAADLGSEPAKKFLKENESFFSEKGRENKSNPAQSSSSYSSASSSYSYSDEDLKMLQPWKFFCSIFGGIAAGAILYAIANVALGGLSFGNIARIVAAILGLFFGWHLVPAALGGFLCGSRNKTHFKSFLSTFLLIVITVVFLLAAYISMPFKQWSTEQLSAKKANIERLFEKIVSAKTVTVTSDALNLRAEASGNAEIVKTLQKGAVLTVTGEVQNGWLPVSHEGARGWVSSQFVE